MSFNLKAVKIGITALVPPEAIYAHGHSSVDVNNLVPSSCLKPKVKLCAWTAIWREIIIRKELELDSLIVVASGDCYNSIVDGQKVESKGYPVKYFFYPFDGNSDEMKKEIEKLSLFLGEKTNEEIYENIYRLKKESMELDKRRSKYELWGSDLFPFLISFSDMGGNISALHKKIEQFEYREDVEGIPIALIGIPPIYFDFHEITENIGFHIVFDELPFEFIRLCGKNEREIANSYASYSFARDLEYRTNLLKKELKKRKVEGIVHYTQFPCHHILEDEILRKKLPYPMLTIQGDLPQKTPEQIKLRLEAFYEMLEES
jgi:benzoyl-CoA reductase/2-hydroxyglutaryl-CoA dehydratase subunit BcrC/BadD/HgdB